MAKDVSCQAWLLEESPAEQNRIVAQAAEYLQSGDLKIFKLVEWIGPFVTQLDDRVQNGLAVEYFANVILGLDLKIFPRQDVDLLAGWFIGRIDEMGYPGVRDCFRVLKHMVDLPKARFTDERATGFLLAIFKNAETERFSKLPLATRLDAYDLVTEVLNRRGEVAKNLGDQFVKGSLAMGALEKDPRNLMKWFAIIRTVLTFPNLEKFQTELWDGISKYFPITYKGDSSIGITADDLKLALRGCIAGSSLFSGLALPFLTEKLDDQVSANIKKDVIRTMDMCVNEYDLPSVTEWSTKLFDALKYEILSSVVDEEIVVTTLLTLADVSRRLSFEVQPNNADGTPLMRYTHIVIKDFNSYLLETRQKFVPQSGRILAAVAASSDIAFDIITKQVLPRLITVFQDTKSASNRGDQLAIMVALIQAPGNRENQARQLTASAGDAGQKDVVIGSEAYLTVLAGFSNTLFELFSEVIANDDDDELLLKRTAIQGMLQLAEASHELLSDAEVGMFISQLCNIIADVKNSRTSENTFNTTDPEGPKRSEIVTEINFAAVTALTRIAQIRPKVAMVVATPQLFEALPKDFQGIQEATTIVGVLEAIAAMSSQYENHLDSTQGTMKSNYRDINEALVQKFETALGSNSNQVYARMILAGLLRGVQLRQAVSSTVDGIPSDRLEDFRILVKQILHHVIELKSLVGKGGSASIVAARSYKHDNSHEGNSAGVEDSTLELVGRICLTVMRKETRDQQELDGKEILTLYTSEKGGVARDEINTVLSGGKDVELEPLIVSRYILAALSPETTITFDPQVLCLALINTYMSNGPTSGVKPLSKLVSDALLDSIAILINKWAQTLAKKAADSQTPMELLRTILNNLNDSPSNDSHTVRLLVICTMAANLRGAHREASELMLLLTTQSAKNRQVAQYLGLICRPAEILTRENSGVIRAISKSRPFHICVPELRKLYQSAVSDSAAHDPQLSSIKTNVLTAFTSIVGNSPAETVMSSIQDIFPMLLMALQDDKVGMTGHAFAIAELSAALHEKPELLKEYVSSVVKVMIVQTLNTTASASSGRQKALSLLRELPDVAILLPACRSLKRDVSKTLDKAVADPSRGVREEAVKCRRAWLDKVLLPIAADED